MSETFQQAVFNDCDYRLLSSDKEISIEGLKAFDKSDPSYKNLYTDKAYKILTADITFDLGFHEKKTFKNAPKNAGGS